MLATFDVLHPSARHLAPAGDVVARAFFDNPIWTYILPSATQRAHDLAWLMDMAVRYGERFGQVFATGAPIAGAAVWLPPDETTITPDRLDEVGFAAMPARLGREAFARFERYFGQLGRMHATLMPERHWYLIVLGVEPALQGRGAGSLLLTPVLDRADRDRLPCYLETANPRNLGFFARHGFESVGEMSLPGTPRTWLLMRNPEPERR